jgi:hypothetical protein
MIPPYLLVILKRKMIDKSNYKISERTAGKKKKK